MSTTAPITEADDGKLPPVSAGMQTALIVFATIAVLCVTLAIAMVAAGGDDSSGGLGTPLTAHVGLTEFTIDPTGVEVAEGGVLHVQNDGTAPHNVSIVDTALKTADLSSGQAEELDISSLAAGAYQLVCLIPGHADAGMKADLKVLAGGGASATPAAEADHGSGHDMDYDQMTKDMLSTMAAFPATTEGTGNVPLAPTEVTADGTKVFDLDMRVADWEVSPGKVVKASTFNGMVPGPRIDLEVGDRVQLRVQNNLEMATDVHLHGLNVENAFDGVAPLTQDLIEPGDSFTYEFVADQPATAMYHPHAMGFQLLPDGMFGTIIVGQVPLPAGRTVGYSQIPADLQIAQELPMVLNDAGVIGYSLNGKSFPATAPIAANVGDWLLVHYYNEGTQIHPMHLHQFDQIVVAKDGFPIDAPYEVDTLNVAPGERFSVLVKVDKPGAWVWHCHILPHVESEAGMFGMVTALIAS
ncbi:MAG: multicopper oxidase domain-containing protein [Actinomycetota bacterium]|nr:multicopper oxidase domain-containing protein [Actinomycetota bacterium]